jgi:phosphoadenosine phosphosulfate reductase
VYSLKLEKMHNFDPEKLNLQFRYASCDEVLKWVISNLYPDVAMTTSFQASGMVLINFLREIQPNFPIYFIDTGYHFPETLGFRDRLVQEWNLNVITVQPEKEKYELKVDSGDPIQQELDSCCHLNKVEPLNLLKRKLRVSAWISAVRRDQSSSRANFNMFMLDKAGYIRIHPLIHWDSQRVWDYIYSHKLPYHPLYDQGFTSIGCFPPSCTTRSISGDSERSGRWANTAKTECGLHLDMVEEEKDAWVRLESKEKK